MIDSDDKMGFLIRDERPTNAYEETMKRLLQSIRLGVINPSERLPSERELAQMLKVSRDTVREAISTLVEAGYVVSKRGRYGGTFVCARLPAARSLDRTLPALSASEIDDISVMRRVLEVGAARIAAERPSSLTEREALVQALNDCQAAEESDYRRLDARLHLVIAELTGSRGLVQAMADMRTNVDTMLESIPLLSPNLSHSNRQHTDIVSAILAQKPDVAADIMRAHVEGTDALMQGFHATRS